MTMSMLKERNLSQEGLEAVPTRPSINSQAFFERQTGLRPAYTREQPKYSIPYTPSSETISKDRSSYIEQGSIDGSGTSTPKLILGVPASTLLFAVIAALAIATAGALGGILGMRPNSCPAVNCKMSSGSTKTNSTTPTSTISASNSFTTDSTVPFDCPALQDQTKAYVSLSGITYTFQFLCNDDCPSNDLVAIWTYSVDMCLDACVSFTSNNSTDKTCGAATFRSVLSNSSMYGGNCFLKTECLNPLGTDFNNKIGSAVLLS